MRKFSLAVLLVLTNAMCYSQVQQVWAVPYKYIPASLNYARANAVDVNGNVYVAGSSSDGLAGTEDYISLVKYDKNGVEKWRQVFSGSNYYTRPFAIELRGNYVYLAGSTSYDKCYVVYKFDINGNYQWSNSFGGFPAENFGYGKATDIAVDPAGNVYITGSVDFFESGNEDNNLYGEIVTIKYNEDGQQQWLKRYNGAAPGNGKNIANAIAIDGAGNSYITGTSQLDGQMDIVTIKYSTTGSELWVKRYNSGTGSDEGNDIAIDAANNVYVTGCKNRQSETDITMVTIKYNTDGTELWLKENPFGVAEAIILDVNANVYITGGTKGFLSPNFKTIKYNTNGDLLWQKESAFYDENDERLYGNATGIALDVDNNVYVTGQASESMATVKYRSTDGSQRWLKTFPKITDGSNVDQEKISIGVDANYNVYVSGGGWEVPGEIYEAFMTIRYSQCEIVCPGNITVNAELGKCDAVVTFADATTTGDCGSTLTYSHASGATFPVGVTTVTVTSDETGASCSFTITVVDNEKPMISFCPANKTVDMNTGVCYATVDPGVATATDNCSVTVEGVRSDGAALNADYPGGITTITWTATDPAGNTATCIQTITVEDNEPPVITGETASTYLLSPPNHTMRDVAIDYTISDNCTYVDTTITVTSNEPVNGTGDGDTDPDWIIVDKKNLKLRAERSANGNGRVYTIFITATDGAGNITAKTLEVSVPHNIKKPNTGQPFKVGSTVAFEGEFWDKPGNKHTAKWLVDGSTVKATVTEPAGNKNGKVTGSYKFTSPGVYKLQMNVTDQNGVTHFANTNGDVDAIVVIYDPNGGNTYGGGYFNSPAGALKSDLSATGKASYGFAMNYFKNSTNPKGETQFEFKVGDFEFNALNFEYLLINNSMAQFKGTGKIVNGQSGIGFIMTVVDGQLDGSGVDKVRMKIYNRNTGSVIYDNQPGASDAALPTQAVGINSTVVINGTQSSQNQSSKSGAGYEEGATDTKISNNLEVIVYPNPSTNNFSIIVQADSKEKITMQVVDAYGRVVETRNVTANSITRFGDRYGTGTYFVQIMQGEKRKIVKLVKLN